MSFFAIPNVALRGVAACVPGQIEEVGALSVFKADEAEHFSHSTGIERRRKAPAGVCSSDLCVRAAEELIASLGWDKREISALVFVSQTPDYILPATAPGIQQALGLGRECYALDISLGCSGWVYGLSALAGVLSNIAGQRGKALLLAGDTPLKFCSEQDRSTYPLFGDAGTATALEYDREASPLLFDMNSDGSDSRAIIIRDGGYRFPVAPDSFVARTRGEEIVSNNLQLELDGMDVFAFGIRRAPESVAGLAAQFGLDLNAVDYFIFHQANLFMNEKIRKKLKLAPEKVPYSLADFGNTSCATIPLTMVACMREALQAQKLNHVACGFGVGLSWGSVHFATDRIVCPPLIEF